MKINPQTEIGKRVYTYLLANPMSTREFAKLVDVTSPTISRLMKGDLKMSMMTQLKLEKFLKMNEQNRKVDSFIESV